MKKRVISAALALCMMLTLLSGTALAAGQHPFTDVPQGHWAGDAVQYVYENNLMGGTDSTTFSFFVFLLLNCPLRFSLIPAKPQ